MIMVCLCLHLEVPPFDAVKGRPCLLVMGRQAVNGLPDLGQHAVGAWECE